MVRYGWLFDRRFDPLRPSFEAFLAEGRSVPGEPINAADVIEDVVPAVTPAKHAELRQPAPEEVNEVFSARWLRGERWNHDKRAPLPLAAFTMDGLAPLPHVEQFGPPGALVHELGDKAFQYRLFRDAGLPHPDFAVLDGDNLVERGSALLTQGALIVQPAYSAGGEQATLIRSVGELAACRGRLTGGHPVVASRFVPGCRTVSGNGVVTRQGRVLSVGITELLQDGFRFDGFILPAFGGPQLENEMHRLTRLVGELLRSHGYWGFFTADAIWDAEGSVFLTEANVRFSGEAAFIAAHVDRNLFDLIAGRTVPAGDVVRGRDDRIVVTKVRPRIGALVEPFAGPGVEAFLSGTADSFRVGYLRAPARVVSAHFVGLAGLRLRAGEGRDEVMRFYRSARQPR